MEMDNHITFVRAEEGVMKLVDIDRRKLQLATTSAKFLAEMTIAAGITKAAVNTQFTMEANATVAHGQQRPQQRGLGPAESVCGICFKPGHGASTCWTKQSQKVPTMTRALSYEDFQSAKAQSRARVNDGLCRKCKKPGHVIANCPEWQKQDNSGRLKRSSYQAAVAEPPAKRASGPRPSWPPVGTGRPTAAASVEQESEVSGDQKEYQSYLAYAATQEDVTLDDEWMMGQGVNPEEFAPDEEDLY
jgi:hypothetical protein